MCDDQTVLEFRVQSTSFMPFRFDGVACDLSTRREAVPMFAHDKASSSARPLAASLIGGVKSGHICSLGRRWAAVPLLHRRFVSVMPRSIATAGGAINTVPRHPPNSAKVRAEPWQRGGVPVWLRPLARRLLPQTPDRGNARDLEGSAIHGSKRVEWGASP